MWLSWFYDGRSYGGFHLSFFFDIFYVWPADSDAKTGSSSKISSIQLYNFFNGAKVCDDWITHRIKSFGFDRSLFVITRWFLSIKWFSKITFFTKLKNWDRKLYWNHILKWRHRGMGKFDYSWGPYFVILAPRNRKK